ncbi:MAG TPA: cell division protein ZapB [Methylomirabilota bacterium]|nr:cell division protein ZapB [Methylomirabilota bacterium]
MTDREVGDGLARLETSVRRAVEVIHQLRAERPRLEQRLTAQEKEIEALRQRLAALEPMEQELRRLRQERKEILSQVDAMLKELTKLDAST